MDRQGEVLIWCRKCSGYARQRMGPNPVNCSKSEQKMMKRIRVLEDGRILAREARSSRIEERMCWLCLVCLMCLFLLLLWSLSFVMVCLVARIGNLWNGSCGTAVLFFLQKTCSLLESHARRDEVRMPTIEIASAVQKKSDATHATANFVFIF